MPERSQRLGTRDIFASWWRWVFFAHANYNFEGYQSTGFAHALSPIIRKLYREPGEIRAALLRHLTPFSSDPEIGGLIHGMTIALEERHAAGDPAAAESDIQALKTTLMGPLGAVGDTLKQGMWLPVWLAVGIGVALGSAGSGAAVAGPVVFSLATVVYTLGFSWRVYEGGYRRGQALVARLLHGTLLDDIRVGGAVLGTALMAALGAQAVKLQAAGLSNSAAGQSSDLQGLFAGRIVPALLALAAILALVWLLRRGASGVSVMLSVTGFGFALALLEAVSRATVQAGLPGLFATAGLPALLGIVLLLAGALAVGRRQQQGRGAVRFAVAFVVLVVLVALSSAGRTEPILFVAHG